MTLEMLRKLLAGEPAYRIKQAAQAVFRAGVSSFSEISTLPAALRERLKTIPILCLEAETVRVSADKRAHKAVLRLNDGQRIESVLLNPKPGLWSACISSQVGCALRCSFCATGLMGFTRNLTAEEISDQVLFWRQYIRSRGQAINLPAGSPSLKAHPNSVARIPGPLDNVIYMGMGEPFLNREEVFKSLRVLTDMDQFGMGDRHLAVSTAGIAPGIEVFGKEFPQVNLALSLHAGDDELRTRLVPINKSYPLKRLRDALGEYFRTSHRRVFIEYVLLAGENDRPKDADGLARFVHETGPLLHVNLIVWNPTETPHTPSALPAAKRFANLLKRAGVSVTFRKNLGQDIEGACGQLVLSNKAG